MGGRKMGRKKRKWMMGKGRGGIVKEEEEVAAKKERWGGGGGGGREEMEDGFEVMFSVSK